MPISNFISDACFLKDTTTKYRLSFCCTNVYINSQFADAGQNIFLKVN